MRAAARVTCDVGRWSDGKASVPRIDRGTGDSVSDGKVDEAGLKALVEFQIAGGTDGIVPCGTTGESPTLDHDEHKHVIDVVIKTVNKRIPVIAGTGSNSTAEAISLTKHAKQAGADGR